MDIVKESRRIDDNLDILLEQTKEELERNNRRFEVCLVDNAQALKDGDLRENSQFEESVRQMQSLNISNSALNEVLKGISTAKAILREYRSSGIVKELSTVIIQKADRQEYEIAGLKEEYVFKLFPDGLSNQALGILASDSELGSRLLGKREGDIIQISSYKNHSYVNYVVKGVL